MSLVKVAYRKYVCPLCGTETSQQTNHFGEIYIRCTVCDSRVLYCMEPEAILMRESRPFLMLRLHYYHLDLGVPEEKERYATILKATEGRSLWQHQYYYVPPVGAMAKALRYHSERDIKFYTHCIFDNQWVTEIGRIHDWFEFDHPNKKMKHGYYVGLTKEALEAREKCLKGGM